MSASITKDDGSAEPGRLSTGTAPAGPNRLHLIAYNEGSLAESDLADATSLPALDDALVYWINVERWGDSGVVEAVGDRFGIHPLILEDILNDMQRPKVDDFGEYLFIVVKMLDYDAQEESVRAEQLSLILRSNVVISFQDPGGDLFEPIRERLRGAKGRVRRSGADYLAYVLIDAVVDNYFSILEKLGEQIEVLEDELVAQPTRTTLQALHDLKREMIYLRQSAWPLREIVSQLQRGGSPLIADSTQLYLRDVYDHTIHIMDMVETFREMLSGMVDLYLSSISNRMNEIMKLLTIISTVFIPLTFLAGMYGMNFKHMPELDWRWSYPILWAIMIVIVLVMVRYFRRKGWL